MLVGIGWMCGFDIEYNPSGRIQKFSGELLESIGKYYSENLISPFVFYRKNFTIGIDDNIYDMKQFIKSSFFQFNKEFNVEFPHMCWLYIESVEIEYIINFNSQDPTIKITPLFQYLLAPTKDIKYEFNFDELGLPPTNKQTIQINSTYPCAGINISSSAHISVLDIKIYGQALSLI
jgi:hypothetical protein